MGFEPGLKNRDGGSIFDVQGQYVPQPWRCNCKGSVTFVFETGPGSVEEALVSGSEGPGCRVVAQHIRNIGGGLVM